MLNLTPTEEFSIKGMMQEPHFSYIESTLLNKKTVSYSIIPRKESDILLIASSGFLIDSVFAGLTEKQIECIAKNAPEDYKTNILKILNEPEMMKGIFEIARSMDQDAGGNDRKNEERVDNVIRYINDNQVAFEF
jgi:hypothetical protein